MAKGIALDHTRVRVAEHVLDEPLVPRDAVQRGAVAVAKVVSSDAVNADGRIPDFPEQCVGKDGL